MKSSPESRTERGQTTEVIAFLGYFLVRTINQPKINPRRAHREFVWAPGWGLLLNRQAMLMDEKIHCFTLTEWQSHYYRARSWEWEGRCFQHSLGMDRMLQNTRTVCPEMVTTVSLTCSLLSFDLHWKEALLNDAEAIVAHQTLLRFDWWSPASSFTTHDLFSLHLSHTQVANITIHTTVVCR